MIRDITDFFVYAVTVYSCFVTWIDTLVAAPFLHLSTEQESNQLMTLIKGYIHWLVMGSPFLKTVLFLDVSAFEGDIKPRILFTPVVSLNAETSLDWSCKIVPPPCLRGVDFSKLIIWYMQDKDGWRLQSVDLHVTHFFVPYVFLCLWYCYLSFLWPCVDIFSCFLCSFQQLREEEKKYCGKEWRQFSSYVSIMTTE